MGKLDDKVFLFADAITLFNCDPLTPFISRNDRHFQQRGKIKKKKLTKRVAFLYANSRQVEIEIMETLPFINSSKKF